MRDYSDPTETLRLLRELEAIGMPDAAFAILHHFEKPESISRHRHYCEMLCEEEAHFRTNSNRLVQQRLELLLSVYKAGHFTVRSTALFEHLAQAILLQVPHDRRSRSEQVE